MIKTLSSARALARLVLIVTTLSVAGCFTLSKSDISESTAPSNMRSTNSLSPAKSGVEGYGVDRINLHSKDLPDASFFDIHAETFSADFVKVFSAVTRVLKNQDDPIFSENQDGVVGVIITGRARHGMVGFPIYEQYIVSVEKDDKTQTVNVTFKLFVHSPDFGKPSDDIGEVLRRKVTFVPAPGKFVYQRAAAFVDRLKQSLR